jgi:hypothetical protein
MTANFTRENIVRFSAMIDTRHPPVNPKGATSVSS